MTCSKCWKDTCICNILSLGQLSFSQNEDVNRDLFIKRLVDNGWKYQDAANEWKNIQEDTESEL